MNKEKLWS
jgi:hypothetical protein